MNTQSKVVGLPWLPLIAVILAGTAWAKLGALGLLAVVVWFVIAYLVSKTSRTAALVLSFVLLPAALLLAAAANETRAALDTPEIVVSSKPPTVSAPPPQVSAEGASTLDDPFAMMPVETCKKNYVGVNRNVENSDLFAGGMCESVNRQSDDKPEFARCVLIGIKTSRSDLEFQEWLTAKCNPIFNS